MVMYSFRFWWWYSGPSLALRIFLEKQSSLLKPDIPSHWPVKKYPFMHLSIYCFKTTISNQKPVVASHVRLGWHLWTPANIIFKIFQMSLCATLSLSLSFVSSIIHFECSRNPFAHTQLYTSCSPNPMARSCAISRLELNPTSVGDLEFRVPIRTFISSPWMVSIM